MSRKKWRRLRLEDLADTEKQKEILKLIAQANDPQGPPGGGCQDCEHCDCGNRSSETATTGR